MKINLKSILNLIKSNLALKCISLGIAIIVWLAVVQYINPDDTRVLDNIPIKVNTVDSVPTGEGLVLVTDFNKKLSIKYKASRDVIAMLNTDKISAYVDLSNATKSGEHSFPVRIDTGGQNITILEQSVKEAVLSFEKSATSQVKINVIANGSIPEGYIKNDPVILPTNLNIEGPESKVSKIVAANVVIGEKKFTQTKVYNCEYEFVDANGNVISKDYITSDYDTVDVTITVLKTKTIPITASVINSSGGYEKEFTNLTITPSTITVAGSEEVLQTLNSYDLGTIDLAERTSSFNEEFTISLQNGVKNVDEIVNVDVKLDFVDIRTKTLKFSSFHIDNLNEEQDAVVKTKTLSVTFRGVADDIAKLDADDIVIASDFQNKKQAKGTSNFPVYAVIPEGLKVGVVGKYKLTVEIK